LRLDDCMQAYEALLVEQVQSAQGDWEHHREVEAAELAEGLARRPGRVARQLAGTKQGAELLLGRWDSLRQARELGSWDEAARAAALDPLGVDRAFRKPGQTALDTPEGSDATAHVRGVIESEAERLRDRLEAVLVASDARDRDRAEAGRSVLL